MTALYGLVFNALWIISLIKNIKFSNQIDTLKTKNEQLQYRCSELERQVREEANKNIILESILKKRNNNQDGERRIY
jgi:hypothetical protein